MDTISTIRQRLHPQLTEMNRIIREYLHTSNPLMNEVVETYLSKKGKQVRPVMVILSAGLFGNVNDDVLYAGAALEMLHNASLIHDDVVDETAVRRGSPTLNTLWGNHIAVLTGDYFVSNALAAGIHTGSTDIIAALSDLGRELSLGEIDQITNARSHRFDEESYLSMIRQKTASLFRNCAKMGASAAGATPGEYARLVEFAELLGLCFQIKDDVFDYFNDPAIGKPTGNDLRKGKVTLPLLHALSSAPGSEAMKQLLMKDSLSEEEIDTLINYAKDNGGIDYAYARMRDMEAQGRRLLSGYPDSIWKQSLTDLFGFIISRTF